MENNLTMWRKILKNKVKNLIRKQVDVKAFWFQ